MVCRQCCAGFGRSECGRDRGDGDCIVDYGALDCDFCEVYGGWGHGDYSVEWEKCRT